MRAIYFIEIEGVKYYKTDTFWTKSSDFTNAKIHEDTSYDKNRFFNSLITGLKPLSDELLEDEDWVNVQRFIGSIYGYQTILSESSVFLPLSRDVILSKPFYLKKIDSVNRKGEVEWTDYMVINRDNLINDILN